MLTKRMRAQIEWHFDNYAADLALYEHRARDILDSGLTGNLSYTGRGSLPGNPTEHKAIRLAALDGHRSWATVVRNTFNAFRFEPEYEVMYKLYIEHKRVKELIKTKSNPDGIVSESTFYFWKNKWMDMAEKWARSFNLIGKANEEK